MASIKLLQTLILVTLFFYYFSSSPSLAASSTYNVISFGAKSDGKSDCTKAFLSAWAAACATTSPATIYVPQGRYLLYNAAFEGTSCRNNAIAIKIDGTLVAPSDYNAIGKVGEWLQFRRVTGVSIFGGTLDGQGAALWACKNSGKSSCPKGATSVAFYNSNNIMVSGLTSSNSQMFHMLIYGCQTVTLINTRISAPGNSPNTDGIHVEHSSGVTIKNSRIGTGDDCVSIGPGASNLWIENLACGPGHGVSIGSLGWDSQEAGVQNVTLKTATFTGTENGVRVKTWARPSDGFVRDVLFQHVIINNVENPIVIDQNYCPNHESCPNQASGVKISDITYEDIHGSSTTQVAVKFDCSKAKPCSGITLDGVNLSYNNKPASASCVNAGGTTSGDIEPSSCL